MVSTIYNIEDICEIKSGKRLPKDTDFVDYKTEYPYIRARDIKNGRINTDALVYIEKEVQNKIKKYIINAGDIAITIVGASVGDVGYAAKEVDGFNLTENAVRLTSFKEFVNSKYLFYILSQKQYRDYMQLIAGAAAQPKLGIYKIQKIKVDLPEIEIQNKIAKILSQYDDIIENNNNRIKLLDKMAGNLYKEWFVNFRFPGYEKITLKKQRPKGWIVASKGDNMMCPEGWKYGEFGIIGSFTRGKNITSSEMIDGEIPVISAGLEPSGYHNESNVRGKSLTVSASGANAGYLKYHMSDIWAADCSYFQDYKKIWFAYNALKFLQPVISNLQVGAAQPHVYPKNINKLCTIIPDEDIIQAYCEKVEPIYEQIRLLKEKNGNLIKQRDMLLPRLMSGKLKV